jgi:hypothetical protein
MPRLPAAQEKFCRRRLNEPVRGESAAIPQFPAKLLQLHLK